MRAVFAKKERPMTDDGEARQTEADERVLERIERQVLEQHIDHFEGEPDMYVRNVLKNIVADILRQHVAAAIEEIASAMTDEIEALARDRLADLRTQLESRDEL
jgi:DNA-binding FrmR family transcriptional regulator